MTTPERLRDLAIESLKTKVYAMLEDQAKKGQLRFDIPLKDIINVYSGDNRYVVQVYADKITDILRKEGFSCGLKWSHGLGCGDYDHCVDSCRPVSISFDLSEIVNSLPSKS